LLLLQIFLTCRIELRINTASSNVGVGRRRTPLVFLSIVHIFFTTPGETKKRLVMMVNATPSRPRLLAQDNIGLVAT
jgi:hypothetical protein